MLTACGNCPCIESSHGSRTSIKSSGWVSRCSNRVLSVLLSIIAIVSDAVNMPRCAIELVRHRCDAGDGDGDEENKGKVFASDKEDGSVPSREKRHATDLMEVFTKGRPRDDVNKASDLFKFCSTLFVQKVQTMFRKALNCL